MSSSFEKRVSTTGTTRVLVAGVGGQGALFASETLALAALADGHDVKKSEIHGVAQRGGPVVSSVVFGQMVHSPLIRAGTADAICALEQLEALRNVQCVQPGGVVVMDQRRIAPTQYVGKPAACYPSDIDSLLESRGYQVMSRPATELAVEMGASRCANVVLLGLLSHYLPLSKQAWSGALERRVPTDALSLNWRAFERGRSLAEDVVPD